MGGYVLKQSCERNTALNEQSIKIAGCSVLLGDCENKVSIVKIYELPDELPNSVVIGRLSHYSRVISFRRDCVADAIFNGLRAARMSIERPIPAQAFIAGEFCQFWYPSQLKTCRKCGDEDHLAAACRSQWCFNYERPGHRVEQCDLPALCRVCLSDGHETTSCLFIYYSSNVTGAKSAEKSYSGAAQSGKLAADARKAKEESSCAKREEGRVHTEKEKEKEQKEKERSGRNEKREIGIGRRRNEKKKNVRIAKNAREGSTTNTRREDTRMMMATGEKRGSIASGTAIAIARRDWSSHRDRESNESESECEGWTRVSYQRDKGKSKSYYLNLIIFCLQCP